MACLICGSQMGHLTDGQITKVEGGYVCASHETDAANLKLQSKADKAQTKADNLQDPAAQAKADAAQGKADEAQATADAAKN